MSGPWRSTGGGEAGLAGPVDSLLASRARLARLASVGRRVGYLAFGLAIGVLAIGLATDFTDGIATTVVGLLVSGSVVLAPAILLHYAVRGAEREDAQ